jgi:hypothetical protein
MLGRWAGEEGAVHWIVTAVIGVAVFLYFVAPLIILVSQRMKADPALNEIDVRSLPPKAWEYLYNNVQAVMNVGFKPIAYLAMPSPVTNVRTYLALLVNPDTDDKAMVTTIFADDGFTENSTLYVEYSTRFESGRVFDTLNSKTLQSFPREARQVRTQTPSIKDPGELFRLHQWVMAQHGAKEPKVKYDFNETPAAFIKRILNESYEKQVKRGWLVYNPSDLSFRPSFMGAYLMTWGLLWPISMFRKMTMSAEEAKVLRQFRGGAGGVRV